MAADQAAPQLVVVGASAGGIEALSALVSGLARDFPAPIAIAQHLDPRQISHLGEILARRSTLPVRTVVEREPLQPGVVFVVPANRHVEITDHEITLRKDGEVRPMPSVDLLLSSAARVYGEQLIAVILTGNGSDGADGARSVKQGGGTVVIQNPATAGFPSMPQSLAPTTVDIVADLEQIPRLLYDLVQGTYAPTQPDGGKALQALLDQLRDRSGIDFGSYKMPTIMRRLQRRMAATGTVGLDDYLRYTRGHPEEFQRLVSSFLIKVTEFYRDAELFDHLRDAILPGLIEEARGRGNELRLWSAGCATGEEAYSLAILVADLLGDELDEFTVRVFATDVDADAVTFARRGVYPASALASLPPDLVDRHFIRVDSEYEIKKRVRALTVFGQHDLGQRAPFPRTDLALCRNVLIYFTTDLQKRALQLFAFSLRNGGFLVLGKAETTSPLAELFALEESRLKIYRRQGERVLIPPARTGGSVSMARAALPDRRRPTGLDLARAERAGQRPQPPSERWERLVLQLPVGVALVDRRYDVQAINGAARRFLGIHGAAVGEDLVHLAAGVPPIALRAVIDAAFRGESSTDLEAVSVTDSATGERRCLRIWAQPQRPEPPGGAVECVLVVVDDVTASVLAREELEQARAGQQEERERLAAQVEQLARANRQLLQANQELADMNTELQSANDEFLVGNEEVQAASEEVETLNEELQATNEELETLNEELQATVEELNTTNDDLEARGVELQDLTVSLEAQRQASEAERTRLAAILSSMGDAVLVVDRGGKPVQTNEAYDRTFGEAAGNPAPDDEQGRPLPHGATPRQRGARGESFKMEFTHTAADGSRCWFEANGHPARFGDVEQGVVVIRDITDRSLRRLQDEFLALASHELRTPLTGLDGFLQMLLRRLPEDGGDDQIRRFATTSLTQARRLRVLVNDLLDATRLQSGKLSLQREPVDLVPLMRGAVETAQVLSETPTIRLEAEVDTLTISGDSGRLEQVLLNLLTNAVTYAPDSDHVDVRLRRAAGGAEIQVQDYGLGIPAEDLPNLFSRFYQVARQDRSAHGGLGLGLFITRELVHAHGGTIGVESTVGRGTTFTIRLPLDAAEAPA